MKVAKEKKSVLVLNTTSEVDILLVRLRRRDGY